MTSGFDGTTHGVKRFGAVSLDMNHWVRRLCECGANTRFKMGGRLHSLPSTKRARFMARNTAANAHMPVRG